jgi:hypothetical protein
MAVYRIIEHDSSSRNLDQLAHAGGHLLEEDQTFPEHVYDGQPVIIVPDGLGDPQLPVTACMYGGHDLSEMQVALRVGQGPLTHVRVRELMQAIALSAGLQLQFNTNGLHLMHKRVREEGEMEEYDLAKAAASAQQAEAEHAQWRAQFAEPIDLEAMLRQLEGQQEEGSDS